MSRHTLMAAAGGVASALLAISVIAGTPGAVVFVYLAPLPLMLAGLAQGPMAVVVGGTTGILVAGAFGGPLVAALYALLNGLPTWFVADRALRPAPGAAPGNGGGVAWYPAGRILALLAAGAAGALVLAALATGGALHEAVRGQLDQALAGMLPEVAAAERANLVEVMAPLFPGLVAGSWLLMTVINAVLAQAILARSGRAARPTPDVAALELPGGASWALVGAAALALAGSWGGAPGVEYLGRNLALVLAAPFLFLGLAVIHGLARRVPFSGTLLAAFYVFLLLLSGYAALVVTGLGFVEQWTRLRERFGGAGNGREDE